MQAVTVLGAGSFGTALAQLLARQGCQVRLWSRHAAQAEAINRTRHNPDYCQAFTLHGNVHATHDLGAALGGTDWIVSGLPSQALRQTLVAARPHLTPRPLVIGTKGIEGDTLMTMDEVTIDVLGAAWQPWVVALSGPSFAHEIMLEHPTAVVLACVDEALAHTVGMLLFCDYFRAYSSTDVVGVEMGGALKNVMAIAAGAISGLGMGENTRAAMITRGVAEISRLAVAKGGNPLTLLGLAGVGDLVLTCVGGLSRNRAVGQALGEGKSVDVAVSGVRQVAEGVRTAEAAYKLAQKLGVDAPITSAVYKVLYEGLPMRDAVLGLVRREPGRELE